MLITENSLQQVNGLSNDGVFTVDIPIGFTYHDFMLALGGTDFDLSHLSNLRFNVNGKVVQEYRTGAELNSVNLFDGLQDFGASKLLLFPMERFRKDLPEANERTLFGTGLTESDRSQLQDPRGPLFDPVRVKSATLTGTITGADAPTLSVTARRSAPRPTNVLRKIRNFVKNPSGSGVQEYSDLPNREPTERLVISSTVVTAVEIILNNISIYERTVALNNRRLLNGKRRIPQANYFVIDLPGEIGQANASWPANPNDDLRVNVTTSGGGVVNILQETSGYLEG